MASASSASVAVDEINEGDQEERDDGNPPPRNRRRYYPRIRRNQTDHGAPDRSGNETRLDDEQKEEQDRRPPPRRRYRRRPQRSRLVGSDDLQSDGQVASCNELLTCSMCLETLREPRSLACFHNFCKVCLGKYVEGLRGAEKKMETFPCPTCRSEFTVKSNQDVGELPSSHFINNMLEIIAIQQKAKTSTTCFHCQDPAINHCSSCEMFMCKKCSDYHDRFPANKDHDTLSVQELSNPEHEMEMRSKLCCMKHKDKVLEIYCETCKELCCMLCLLLNHQKANHSCVAVSEFAKKQKKILQSSCTTLDEKLVQGKEALYNICGVIKSLERNAKTAKDQIEKQKENILKIVTEELDERAKKMKQEVDRVHDELHDELSKQHDEMKDYLDKVQASVSLPKNLLKRGSIEEMILSQKLIDEKIEKLGNEEPEYFAPVNDGSIQYVPDHIGSMNVDKIVDNLGYVEGGDSGTRNLRKFSSILKGEIAFMKQLQKWLGEKCKWSLCYRASRDGWSGQDFHKHCDNKGPTVVLVKANGCIFGGYTDRNWDCARFGTYKRSNSSFLFSLRNESNLAPFIANIKQGKEQNAIYCYSGYGPTFGEGYDLHICNNPQVNNRSYSNFGHTYQLSSGYVYESEEAKNLLAGQNKFKTTEIEVFN